MSEKTENGIKERLVAVEVRITSLEDRVVERLAALEKSLDRYMATCVTKAELAPVRYIAYGIASVALLGVVGAVVTQVLK